MDRLSEHFWRSEFACTCGCGFDTVDVETLTVLIDLRQHFASPIAIVSGCRCIDRNRKVGGGKRSQHLFGRAADIKVQNVSPVEVYSYLLTKYTGRYGFGLYSTFVHIDTRTNGPARWGEH